MLTHVVTSLWLVLCPMLAQGAGSALSSESEKDRGASPVIQVVDQESRKDRERGGGKPENPPIPEPGTLAIVGTGLIALSILRRRRQQRQLRAGLDAR